MPAAAHRVPPHLSFDRRLRQADPMHFIGLDLAWGPVNRTGIAVADSDGRLLELTTVVTDEDIVQALAPYVSDECLVAIDAPLLVTNKDRSRPAERHLSSDFGKFHAGARPTGKWNPLFDPPRGALLAEELGLDINPESTAARRAIEVYPHPATVAVFGLNCIVKYKNGCPADRRNEMLRLIGLIESLATFSLPMQVTAHNGWARLRQDVDEASRQSQLNLAEDPIDAVLCAYIAMVFAHRRDEITIYGDFPANGYIATPTLPAGLKPDCPKAPATPALPPDVQPIWPAPAATAPATPTPIADLVTEVDRCRAYMNILQDRWADLEDLLDLNDATHEPAPDLADLFGQAALLAGSADVKVQEIVERLPLRL
jgi:predicted RNase H-like nuclease